MEDREAKLKRRRIVCSVLLIVSLMVTLAAGHWLRRVAGVMDSVDVMDQLPLVIRLGMTVGFLLHPLGWTVPLVGCFILLFMVRKGTLDLLLAGLDVIAIIWAVLMVFAAISATLMTLELQKALSD